MANQKPRGHQRAAQPRQGGVPASPSAGQRGAAGQQRGGAPTDATDAKAQVAKQARLWLLSLICASAGAITVFETNSLARGIGVFLLVLLVLGPLLYLYEKVHARRRSR